MYACVCARVCMCMCIDKMDKVMTTMPEVDNDAYKLMMPISW